MFGQFVINGFITGLLYALLAIGFALVYNTTHIFHIAAAGIYVFAAYIFWFFTVRCGIPVWASAGLSVLLTMVLSWLTELGMYRPLRNRNTSPNVAMIASIGLMVVLVNVIALLFGNETKVVDNTIRPTYTLGRLIISTQQLYQLTVSAGVICLFLFLLSRTRIGLRLRALSLDASLYDTMGYDRLRAFSLAFLGSGFFIGLASCLTVYDTGLDPNMGMNMLINAMVALIVGGTGRFGTCVVGGLLLGLLQSTAVYFFASNWQPAITFLLLLCFLFLRPQGIAGYKQRVV